MIIVRDYDEYCEDERLYSTGDEYLDDLLEKAFCEGYEYAQREFAEEEEEDDNNKKKGTGKKVLKGAGIAAGSAAALATAYYGGRKLQKKHIDKLVEKSAGGTKEYLDLVKKQQKLEQGNRLDRFGRKVAKKVKGVFSRKKGAYAAEPDAY